jgi:hypothetical protein
VAHAVSRLLRIYLNDHLASATAAVELARRTERAERSGPLGRELREIAEQQEADRRRLLDLMRSLDVPVDRIKVVAAHLGERIGRFKLNGHLLSRSPLSTVQELEVLLLAVEHEAAAWRALASLADPRLDAASLAGLVERTTTRAEALRGLALRAAAGALAS